MTTMNLAIFAGLLVGTGLAAALLAFAPTRPALGEFLGQLSPSARLSRTVPIEVSDYTDRVGVWLMRHLPLSLWVKPPTKDLDLLQIPLHRFYADKAAHAAVGLILPLLFGAAATVLRIPIPFVIPAAASLAAAVALSFLPDMDVKRRAAAARVEFAHALSAYLDLVAIARNSGAQTRQAMEVAANTGDSWAFTRIRESLLASKLSGTSPWDALRDLSESLDVPGLSDLADIMRMSAEDNAAVYTTLRATATSMRNSLMNTDLAQANSTTTQISYPAAALALIFTVMLATPAFLRLIHPS
ncbi:type II secretion system F family protein [Propionicimonas sp.]|uniref:type II secretion system F family protein n=1 Tax=Propionicimonas sp. TaxID=1955623 RepID=UPI001844C231|nr:type II secretion system F family protein [Propionicimonas sp.]MBA3019662.1 type II secretion system F family protein [Propionicimonas sp.]MBU4207993.1 type II secretion system F family protein [Actinomycetota bacterium]MBU4411469.1 type II secretion system F family protein [Actinomycetota bacterium]MCG2805781.1 type II secretion system F family protein [Propionicimonas sp.]